ncbi:MAG: hypothetical protein KJ566_00350 [Nanoarchaeota archaeon]|nr:hypothetical protein [Nanoarchaeota archaeon]
MKNKKAELTTQQLVTLIILIVSFAVILFLLFRLDLGKETEAELCHNSVIMRGSAVVPEDTIPLDCSRKYICITKDGSCNSMTKPEIKKVKTDSDVYKVLADEMANCWWMFGEGKVNYVSNKYAHKSYCSVCSQIAFDKSLKKSINAFSSGQLDQNVFYNYLVNENYTSEKTYAEYLFGINYEEILKEQQKIASFGTINLENQFFVVMGITSEVGTFYKWLGGGIVVVGTIGVIFTPLKWVAGSVIVGGVGTGLGGKTIADLFNPEIAAIVIDGNGIANQFMAPTIVEANSDKFKALNCHEILTTA